MAVIQAQRLKHLAQARRMCASFEIAFRNCKSFPGRVVGRVREGAMLLYTRRGGDVHGVTFVRGRGAEPPFALRRGRPRGLQGGVQRWNGGQGSAPHNIARIWRNGGGSVSVRGP